MSVIVALEQDGKVFLGGDSYCSSGIVLDKCDTPKVYKIGPLGVGICGSIKAEQILKKVLQTELKKKRKISRAWIENDLTNSVRLEMVKSGLISSGDPLPDGSNFLIAFEGKIFLFEDDFSIWRSANGYQVIGAGASFAKGALCALRKEDWLSAEEKVRRALHAADNLCTMVLPPFTIIAV